MFSTDMVTAGQRNGKKQLSVRRGRILSCPSESLEGIETRGELKGFPVAGAALANDPANLLAGREMARGESHCE